MPPRARTPTPEEAALLTVYQDAERALLGSVAAEVRDVVDAPDGDTDAQRVVGARRVRESAEGVLLGLERGKRGMVDAVIGAAADRGGAAAAAELGRITGRPDGADGINRAALDQLAGSVLDRVTPAHTAILRSTDDAFRDVMARVLPAQIVGAETRRQVTQRALWALTDRGIDVFTDRAGRRWTLSAYCEMAARTAGARAEIDAQLARLSAAGRDLVIVQGSGDRCEKCRAWSGKILAITGGAGTVEVEHPIRDGVMLEVQVAGSVDDARRAGLFHPQCRCSVAAYTAGLTRAQPDPPDTGQYKARQRQRAIERDIRALKARELAALDPAALKAAKKATRAAQGRMRDHLAANPDLLRRPYREQIGTGNLPDQGLRERVGPGGDPLGGPRVTGQARRPRDQSDAELDRNMQGALGREDFDEFERLAGETDRRDVRRAADRDRRAEGAARREEQKAAEFERLLDRGVDEESAVADVYGISVPRQRRDRAIAQLRANGYQGRTFDELARGSFRDHVYTQILRAEASDDVGGFMVSKQGMARGIDGRSLFTGTEARARKWASDELKQWWDRNGRPDFDRHKAELLGEGDQFRANRGAGGDFLA